MSKAPEKNTENRPEKNAPEKKNESGWRGLMQAVVRFFLHQWPFKLLSLAIAIVLWSGPVSYTHLDVYKRQVSLFVRFIDLESGESETRIVNKNV